MNFRGELPPPSERKIRRNTWGEVIDPEFILADSEYGPVFTEENVARISSILDAHVAKRATHDHHETWELKATSFSLMLTHYKSTAPYTVDGDAEIAYVGNRGSFRDNVQLRGISWIEANPEELDHLRFVLDSNQHYAQLTIDRDAALLEFRSEEKFRSRIPRRT